ncbi:MAG TPA: Yip1 family protein [Bacillota bacterium]
METSVQVNQEQSRLGFFARLGNLFSAPSRVFAQLREKPDLIWPLIFFAVMAGLSLATASFNQKLLADSFPKYAAILSQAQAQKSTFALIGGAVGSLVGLAFFWVLGTGIYYLMAKIVGGESVKFVAFLAMVGYTNIATLLQTAFQSGVLALTGSIPPVGLETGMELSDRFFTTKGLLLSSINPFAIFGIILIIIALEKAFKISRTKAVSIALIYWVASIAISIGLSTFSFSQLR